ncbi:MAG: isoamylase early set domain-containing protein [Thermodesulfobacteriota bacterium]|nr:isoamylase early set domain-containing protein [Thermodesulfobacteriota bacterium]
MACKTGAKKKMGKAGSKKKRKVIVSTEFTLTAPESESVYLAGDFNDWDPTQYSMRKYKNGICKKKLKLKPGRYEYQFIVDDKWQVDPENSDSHVNIHGTDNSVITIGEEVIEYK